MRTINEYQQAFTLVELMVVTVVIGFLAALAIPAFNQVRMTSQAKTCVNNLRQIVSAKDQYFLENGEQPTVKLTTLIDPDGYIRAMPLCPNRGNYTDPITHDAEPECSYGEPGHVLPSEE